MDLGISGKRAAVAAASQGLGRATAAALAAEGVQVAICSRSQEKIEAAAAGIPGAIPLVADVSTEGGAAQFVRDARDALGGIDILVANGGGPPPGTFASTDLGALQPGVRSELPRRRSPCASRRSRTCRSQGWGRVLAITSVSVRQPIPALILSNTARAGVTGFLKTLAREVAADGVTANSIQPGSHDTERIRSLRGDAGGSGAPGRSATRTDFGRIAAFLCSESAKFITGAAVNVDGGAYQGLQ